jgi:uncharacterized membrane protein YbhN (UPF0104 family)
MHKICHQKEEKNKKKREKGGECAKSGELLSCFIWGFSAAPFYFIFFLNSSEVSSFSFLFG